MEPFIHFGYQWGQMPFMWCFLKQFFDSIPISIIEAARIDGCKDFRYISKDRYATV